jgi:CRISPR-associated protein Cas1
LYVVSAAHLSSKSEQLWMAFSQESERPPVSIPLEDIGLLVVESNQATLTQHLLSKLAEYNIAWLGCGADHMPNYLGLPLEGNSITGKRTRLQFEATEPLKKNVWQQLVRQKIINQAAILSRHGHAPTSQRLLRLSKNVKSGDVDNCEGVAAAAYWPALFGSDFVRMRGGVDFNAPLNYGYAVLRAAVARAIVGAGMLPVLGLHHKNQYNAYALADDLMEPFRPYVDSWVYTMPHELYQPVLTTEGKKHVLGLLTVDVIIDKKTSPLWNALQTSVNSLVLVFQGTQRKLLVPDCLG